jgi:phosphoribosylaminoimidazole-succinocarboxamide synthase
MLVKRLKPMPVEAVVRGYLAGSGWKEYQENRPDRVWCETATRAEERLEAARAHLHACRQGRWPGDHDENITYRANVEIIGAIWPAQHPRHQHRSSIRPGPRSRQSAASSSPTPSSSSVWIPPARWC